MCEQTYNDTENNQRNQSNPYGITPKLISVVVMNLVIAWKLQATESDMIITLFMEVMAHLVEGIN